MARTNIPITDKDTTITRLVCKSVVEYIAKVTRLNYEDIVYKERGGNGLNSINDNRDLKLDVGDYLIVEYNELLDKDVNSIPWYINNAPYIFESKELGINIVPNSLNQLLNIDITLRSKSYDRISQWKSRYNQWSLSHKGTLTQDILYNYTLPLAISAYLSSVYDATELLGGYDRTATEFIDRYFSDGIIVRSDQKGKSDRLVINNLTRNCLGIFESISDNITSTKEDSFSEIKINYILRYEKIVSVVLNYQRIIHNQILDTSYLENYVYQKTNPLTYSSLRTTTSLISDNKTIPKLIVDVFYIKKDRWLPKIIQPFTQTLLMIPFAVDELDLNAVFSLNDLDTPTLSPELLNDMTLHHTNISNLYNHPLLIECFSVGSSTFSMNISVDETLNITTETPMDIRRRHYIRISIINSLDKLNLNIFNDNPSLFYLYIKLLSTNIAMDGVGNVSELLYNITTLGNGVYLSDAVIMETLKYVRSTDRLYVKWESTATDRLVEVVNILTGS